MTRGTCDKQLWHGSNWYPNEAPHVKNRTLPQIADEDIEAIFYALDDSGDFKVSHTCPLV